MATIVLIPSSRYVDAEMQLDVGRIPPALIPIKGKPLLCSILDRYQRLPGTTHFTVVGCDGIDLLQKSVKQLDLPVQLLEIPQLPDLGTAILHALEKLDLTDCQSLIVNFGDTLIDADMRGDVDTVYYDDLSESFRWTTFEQSGGRITEITDKGIVDDSRRRHVFTGVFLLKKPKDFVDCLKSTTSTSKLGLFYAALSKYLSSRPYSLQKVEEWHDFGHVDNYYAERKKNINKRFFNEVSIDSTRPVITKKSSETAKFLGEIAWYLELPTTLKPYVPQVFDYSLAADNPFIRMEFYGYPTVAELLLSGGHSLGIWNHVFDGIFGVMREMQNHLYASERDNTAAAIKEMYVEKTIQRVEKLRGHPVLGRFFTKEIIINEHAFPCLNEILSDLRTSWERLIPSKTGLGVIHGDLCASNILFDPRSRIIKLIDPRGRFGNSTLYGDYRYDLAKLSHSFNAHYELIINDLFFAVCEENSIAYSIHTSPYQDCVSAMFNQRVNSLYFKDKATVRLLESILFLSMLPLHSDYLNRQVAMLATGVQRYSMAIKGLEARA